MGEIRINMENLTAEEREQLMALAERAAKPKSKVWTPEENEEYWFLDEYCTLHKALCGPYTRPHFEAGNGFRTRNEAAEEAKRRKMLTKWKRLSIEAGEGEHPWDGNREHWYCYWSVTNECIRYASHAAMLDTNTTFPAVKSLAAAIGELGEENVKRYILGVT